MQQHSNRPTTSIVLILQYSIQYIIVQYVVVQQCSGRKVQHQRSRSARRCHGNRNKTKNSGNIAVSEVNIPKIFFIKVLIISHHVVTIQGILATRRYIVKQRNRLLQKPQVKKVHFQFLEKHVSFAMCHVAPPGVLSETICSTASLRLVSSVLRGMVGSVHSFHKKCTI